jgi:hypothetical protein
MHFVAPMDAEVLVFDSFAFCLTVMDRRSSQQQQHRSRVFQTLLDLETCSNHVM